MSSETTSPIPGEDLLLSNHGTVPTGSENGAEAELLAEDSSTTEIAERDSRSSTSNGKRKERDEEDTGEVTSEPGSSSPTEEPLSKKPKIVTEAGEISLSAVASLVESRTHTGKRKEREDDQTTIDCTDQHAEEEGSRHKRRRAEERTATPQAEIPTVPEIQMDVTVTAAPLLSCYFFTLPTELILAILVLTGSPKYLLAFSRTCKRFRALLLDESQQTIWRNMRKACTYVLSTPTSTRVVKLPEPMVGMTEVQYAAFVFDSAKCEVCRQRNGWLFPSFALSARLCKDASCSMPGSDICEIPRDVFQRARKIAAITTNESSKDFPRYHYEVNEYWPHTHVFYARRDEMQAILDKFPDLDNMTAELDKEFKDLVARKNVWMEFCVQLHKWQTVAQDEFRLNRNKNDAMTKKIASKHGWSLNELQATVFKQFKQHKNDILEEITEIDVCMIKDQIVEGILAGRDKSGRRQAEITLMQNRKDVEKYYHNLRSAKKYPYLPSLSTFRQLPVIEMLQASSSVNVADSLHKDRVIQDLLKSQVENWSNQAKAELAVTLGFPKNWRDASKNVLHPVERVTARFICNACNRMDNKHKPDGCLDFVGACLHECGVGNEQKGRLKKGKKAIWNAKNFVRDEKAAKVLQKAIDLLGYPEDRNVANYIHKVGLAAVCKSCDKEMVLDSRSIVGHSHRHENMEISFLPLETIVSYLGGFPYEHGLSNSLLGYEALSNAGKREINRINFGCRHCLRVQQDTDAAALSADADSSESGNAPVGGIVDANDSTSSTPKIGIELSSVVHRMHDVGVEGPYAKPPRLFSFNGMRSHLKEKHHVEVIRDEDFFCFHSVELNH